MLAHKYKIDSYLMENEDELCRLLVKTDLEKTKKQALWAGIKPGMRVADIGCGPGITSYLLSRLTEPGGEVVGLDRSGDRIAYANQHYSGKNVKFTCRDVRDSLEDLGKFDFIWARFIL